MGALFTPSWFSCRQSPDTLPLGDGRWRQGWKRRRAVRRDQTAAEDSFSGPGKWLAWLSGRCFVVLCLCLSFGGNKLTASEWINGKCLRPAASHHRQRCTITAEPIICDYWDCAHVWRIKVSPQFDPFHLQQIVDIQHQCIKAAHTDNQLCKAKTHSHLPSSRPHSQEHHYPYPSRERSCLFISESILYTSRRTTSGRLR